MTEAAKKRIAEINSGIVPDGYKKTKVGIVPVEWDCVKLGEVLEQRKTLVCISEDAPLLSFTIEQGVIEPTEKKSNKRDFLIKDITTKKFALTEVGDIIYNPANLKFGAIHRNNLRRGVVSPIYGIFYGEQNSVFMGYLLHSQSFIDYAKIYTEGTVEKLKTLKADTFLTLKVALPPLAEQQKIAEILSTQEKLIELHEKKVEKLKELKKAYLQKMFPQKGSKYPEIRFKGFTDAWEQRKLSDIYASIGNAFVGTATPYYVSDGHFYLESNNVKDGQINHNTEIFINDEFYKKQEDKWLHTGDMVMVQSGHVGHAAVIPEELDNSAAHALIMFRNPKVKINPYFLNYQYQTVKAKKKIENITTGNTIKHILASDMQDFVVDVPNFDEQEKIGQYFTNLDTLITLHQRKLDKEKEKKKALMQLLLTGKVRVKP